MASKLTIRQLDAAFSEIKAFQPKVAPRGWLYAIRIALGMTREYVAKKMGITASAVQQIEEREQYLNITLASLQTAAQALGCHVVYAIVPNQPLKETVHIGAEQAAKNMMFGMNQTMALEDQSIGAQPWKDSYHELVEEFEKNPKLIWRWIK